MAAPSSAIEALAANPSSPDSPPRVGRRVLNPGGHCGVAGIILRPQSPGPMPALLGSTRLQPLQDNTRSLTVNPEGSALARIGAQIKLVER